MSHKIYDSSKQFFIKLPYPPFVDGNYEDLRELIKHLRVSSGIKNENIFFDAIKYIDKLEDQELYPIKYIKRYLLFYFKLNSNLLDKYDDKTIYSYEEAVEIRDKIEKMLHEKEINKDITMKCPFPYTKEQILEKKKDILNIVYTRIEVEKAGSYDKLVEDLSK